MSRTIAVHVRYNSLYVSLPSSAKPQCEMTKFFVVWRTQTAMVNFSQLLLELNAVDACLACMSKVLDRYMWLHCTDLQSVNILSPSSLLKLSNLSRKRSSTKMLFSRRNLESPDLVWTVNILKGKLFQKRCYDNHGTPLPEF